jgi:hypothetical protein
LKRFDVYASRIRHHEAELYFESRILSYRTFMIASEIEKVLDLRMRFNINIDISTLARSSCRRCRLQFPW